MKESNLVKFLRFGIYLTAFVPLIIFKDFISPFHFGKVVVFRSLVEILGAGYLVLILKDRSYLPRRDKVFWAFFLFVLAFSLTTITSVLPYPSFWGSLERMGGLWTFWHYFLFFIILTSVFTKKEHWQKLLNLTIFAGVLSAFYGFGQKTNIEFFVGSGGRERIFGTIGNPALFAGYELLSVFLSLIMYLQFKVSGTFFAAKKVPDTFRRTSYLFAFVITSVAALMTAVRGSVLGYAVGLSVFAFLWMRHKKSRIGSIVFNVLIGSIVLFVVFSSLFSGSSFVKNSRYLSRITDLSLTSVTVQTRFWAWQAGLKGWSENPKTMLLGWGPENFNIPFSKHFNPKFFVGLGSETLFDRAHNMFVEVLVTMGVIGFLAYVNIFIALFASLKKLLKNTDFVVYGAGFISAIIAYIIHNSFIFDTSANFIVFFTIMGFVSWLARPRAEIDLAPAAPSRGDNVSAAQRTGNFGSGTVNIIAIILVGLVSVLIYKTNILPAKANYATTRAIIFGWASDFNGALAKYKESLSYDVPGKYEYRHRLTQYLVGGGGPSVKEKAVREAYGYALNEIDKNIKENPIDYLPYLYGSRLNIILGKDDPKSSYNDRALNYSMKALELSPTFIRTYYEIAQAYLNKKDYSKAIEFFQRVADLNSENGLSYWYLGVAKIESGNASGIKDLEKALTAENRYSPSEQDYLRLVSIYLANKDFVHIANVYEGLIAFNPKNPQYFASLAAAYANLGRIDDAVAMARKTVQVDPSFEADARVFVKSLGREF
ncbi:MAG: O-antigen ligase family protein [Patescibacteria group bacterium]